LILFLVLVPLPCIVIACAYRVKRQDRERDRY
jgi:hypothetical protein